MSIAISHPVEEAEAPATKSSFYLAMRLMAPRQRHAMFEIYAFCRAVDDIADNGGPRELQLARLQRWRSDLDEIYAGRAPARQVKLSEAIATFSLARDDFFAVIDGMEMDVLGTAGVGATDWATLDLYCDRVASAVGRLSVRVFGMPDEDGRALAHHLGRALQLTNILRDLDEDAAIGRLYLPSEALHAAGINTTDARLVIYDAHIESACAPVAARAEAHFREAERIFERSPRAAVRTPRIMGAAYRLILNTMYARGWRAPRAPIKLSKLRLLWIVMRCFLA